MSLAVDMLKKVKLALSRSTEIFKGNLELHSNQFWARVFEAIRKGYGKELARKVQRNIKNPEVISSIIVTLHQYGASEDKLNNLFTRYQEAFSGHDSLNSLLNVNQVSLADIKTISSKPECITYYLSTLKTDSLQILDGRCVNVSCLQNAHSYVNYGYLMEVAKNMNFLLPIRICGSHEAWLVQGFAQYQLSCQNQLHFILIHGEHEKNGLVLNIYDTNSANYWDKNIPDKVKPYLKEAKMLEKAFGLILNVNVRTEFQKTPKVECYKEDGSVLMLKIAQCISTKQKIPKTFLPETRRNLEEIFANQNFL